MGVARDMNIQYWLVYQLELLVFQPELSFFSMVFPHFPSIQHTFVLNIVHIYDHIYIAPPSPPCIL